MTAIQNLHFIYWLMIHSNKLCSIKFVKVIIINILFSPNFNKLSELFSTITESEFERSIQ